jgi:CysZ protein
MLADALDSLNDVFSPAFRGVMIKSLLLTAAVLVLAGFALDRVILALAPLGPGWLAAILSVAVALGLVAAMIFVAAPTTSLVASFYLDEIAGIVERAIDPNGPPGRPAPAIAAALYGLRFAALSLLVNLIALILLLAPGIGFASFFIANGYLLGREYFELAAMRFRSATEARTLRRRNNLMVFAYGVVISAFVAVPILNLFTPLFATALMARLHRRLA